MAFFRNQSVNLLNLHTAIAAIALAGGGAFVTVYLLRAGVSVPGVLLADAAIFLSRLVIRSFLLPIGIGTGLRRLVVVGAAAMALQFPLVAEVHGVGPVLYCMVLVSAIGDTIYWPSYHAYYAALGDEEHRGHQLGIREAMSAFVSIVSPLIAGWLLVAFGPRTAFALTALVQLASAIPLIWTPDVAIARKAPGVFRAARPAIALFIADGWITAGYGIAWGIALFFTLGQNYVGYGGALAASALAGAVGGLLLGRTIDLGHGVRAVRLALGVFALVGLMRALVIDSPALAVIANALGALSNCLYQPAQMTAVYNQAKRSACTLRFHIVAEGAWDVGFVLGLSVAALLVWFGLPLSVPILLSLTGGIVDLLILERYYRAHPTEVVEVVDAGEMPLGAHEP